MWGIRQFCFAIMIFLLNTLFSNLSILIFEAFKVWIRYSVIFPDLNDLLQSYKDIHKPHLYNIKKSPKTRCFRGNLLFFDIRLNYLFENCGARRAALRPYSPDLDPKRPVFMRFFGLSSLSKPIGKPTKSRNFWCSLTQPECSIHNAA